jgi:hypothetical protein
LRPWLKEISFHNCPGVTIFPTLPACEKPKKGHKTKKYK